MSGFGLWGGGGGGGNRVGVGRAVLILAKMIMMIRMRKYSRHLGDVEVVVVVGEVVEGGGGGGVVVGEGKPEERKMGGEQVCGKECVMMVMTSGGEREQICQSNE